MRIFIYVVCILVVGLLLILNPEKKETCKNFDGEPLIRVLNDSVRFNVLLSTGDAPTDSPNYRFTGLADGIGSYKLDDENSIIIVNHELGGLQGALRAHGTKGAFISKWTFNRNSKKVIKGEDLIQKVNTYNPDNKINTNNSNVIQRLCSGDLPLQSSLFFKDGSVEYGTREKIFFSGEELSTFKSNRHGRAFAHVLSGNEYAGKSFELSLFGKMAFENIVLSTYPQKLTIAMLLDDATNFHYDKPKSAEELLNIKKNPPSELYV
ncbi:MAG: hypothetical protein GTO02_06225, partial [Candidatus Dadabacteria bacterium]|nr:hypothetical protein [Candidatus Dadabacteria bacterium]NIQ13997.1 hypothetical protein [Candidatus Dadabacteria bacterium]